MHIETLESGAPLATSLPIDASGATEIALAVGVMADSCPADPNPAQVDVASPDLAVTPGAVTSRPVTLGAVTLHRRAPSWVHIGLVATLLVFVLLDYRTIVTTLGSAVTRALGASSSWLLAAVAFSIASMIAFGLLRQRTVVAGGGTLAAREGVAVSYAAGAIHLTAPGGIVLSTAYVFRRLQRQGVPPTAVTWSLAISGVLSSGTLIALGALGFAVGSGSGSAAALLPAAVTALTAAVAITLVVRHPEAVTSLLVRALRGVNRLLRRPADAGVFRVRSAIADLRAIRPAPREWFGATLAAAANWLLDLMCLWACAEALGVHVAPWLLLTSYSLAMLGAGISPLPGGVGVVDGILVVALTAGAGVPAGVAIGAVLLYRVIALGDVLVGGWGSVGSQSLRARVATREIGSAA